MLGLQVLLAVAFCVMVLASDPLKGNLTSAGIHAVFPGGNGYASASTACTFILLFITFRTNLTIPVLAVNLRFSFKPAAVAFPNSAEQVSEIIKLGSSYKLQVVARSGGVQVLNAPVQTC